MRSPCTASFAAVQAVEKTSGWGCRRVGAFAAVQAVEKQPRRADGTIHEFAAVQAVEKIDCSLP